MQAPANVQFSSIAYLRWQPFSDVSDLQCGIVDETTAASVGFEALTIMSGSFEDRWLSE